MPMIVDAFDWDTGNQEKCRKHGVSIGEIEFVMRHEPRVAPDAAHSAEELRSIAVGRTQAGRLVFIAFTLRRAEDRVLVRPISARYMHRKEAEAYEAQNT